MEGQSRAASGRPEAKGKQSEYVMAEGAGIKAASARQRRTLHTAQESALQFRCDGANVSLEAAMESAAQAALVIDHPAAARIISRRGQQREYVQPSGAQNGSPVITVSPRNL